ncbi:MAG: hypothetical protein SGPRY_014748 [Prymnesium sp.]
MFRIPSHVATSLGMLLVRPCIFLPHPAVSWFCLTLPVTYFSLTFDTFSGLLFPLDTIEFACKALLWCAPRLRPALKLFLCSLQLGANLTEALRVVLSQKLIAGMSMIQMQFYVTPAQAFCLVVASLYLELHDPAERSKAMDAVVSHPGQFLLVGVLGLAQQAATLIIMRAFGSVVVKLLGQARNAALVLFEVSRGNVHVSIQQLVGYSISILFFCTYVWERQARSNSKAHKPKSR